VGARADLHDRAEHARHRDAVDRRTQDHLGGTPRPAPRVSRRRQRNEVMTARSTVHSTFTLDRVFNASPARVYRAFADKDTKEQWFSGPDDWELNQHDMDFRVGGTEVNAGGPPGGPVHKFDAKYHEIVADARIVYSYDLFVGDTQLSTSLATLEFVPDGD